MDASRPVFLQFLSTPSARRATAVVGCGRVLRVISIHALREEGDFSATVNKAKDSYFYPRPPRGGRPINLTYNQANVLFLSTPSARRATRR